MFLKLDNERINLDHILYYWPSADKTYIMFRDSAAPRSYAIKTTEFDQVLSECYVTVKEARDAKPKT